MINRQQVLRKCLEIENRFIEKIKDITWKPKGLFFTEGLLFCAMCELLEIDLIIESGVRNGVSTEIWLKYFNSDIEVCSIDIMDHTDDVEAAINRLNNYDNVTFHIGDGAELVKGLSSATSKNVGILFDGPKSMPAITCLKECAEIDNVKFGAIHDMGQTAKEIHDKSFLARGRKKNKEYSESIDVLNEWDKLILTSDDKEFVDSHFHINDSLCGENEDWDTYKNKYPIGCGLAIVNLRNQQ